jgi:hypothetical protein
MALIQQEVGIGVVQTGGITDSDSDPVRSVKSTLKRVVAHPTDRRELLEGVSGDLARLVERVERVRSLSGAYCGVSLSPYVTRMLKMVGRVTLREEVKSV